MSAAHPRSPWRWMTLALRRAGDFRGRSSRPEFLWALAGFLGAGYVGGRLLALFGVDPAGWFAILLWVAPSVPALAVLVRRLHDIGRSGWWPVPPLLLLGPAGLWVADVPLVQTPRVGEIVGLLVLVWLSTLPPVMLLSLVWTARAGDPAANRHGPPPMVD